MWDQYQDNEDNKYVHFMNWIVKQLHCIIYLSENHRESFDGKYITYIIHNVLFSNIGVKLRRAVDGASDVINTHAGTNCNHSTKPRIVGLSYGHFMICLYKMTFIGSLEIALNI